MMKDQLKIAKETLMGVIQTQLGNLEQVDAKELGEVFDMVKDSCEACKLEAEAKYYEKITEAMEDAKEEEEMMAKLDRADSTRYYNDSRYRGGRVSPTYMRRGYSRDYYPEVYDPNNEYYMNRNRMYYDGSRRNTRTNDTGNRNTTDSSYNTSTTESRYDRGRRTYTESKMMHSTETPEDKTANVSSLKKFLNGISDDIVSLSSDMDTTEKDVTKKFLQELATKIV